MTTPQPEGLLQCQQCDSYFASACSLVGIPAGMKIYIRLRHFRWTTSSQTEWVVGKILTVLNKHSTTKAPDMFTCTGKTYSTTRLGEEGIGISFPNLMRKQSTSVQKQVANIQEECEAKFPNSAQPFFDAPLQSIG